MNNSLSSIINLNIRLPKTKVFAAFVDFRKAFDGLSHDVLWYKLFKFGVSVKFINILRNLYSKARVQIRINSSKNPTSEVSTLPLLAAGHAGVSGAGAGNGAGLLTDFINVGQGILQGDTLSPLLFNVFIADFEDFLRSHGVSGLNIDGITDLVSLFYADDLVLLSYSVHGLQKMLNLLYKYCEIYSLCVNVEKSKVVVFRKKGRLPGYCNFKYGNENLEIVSNFTYLGIKFSSSGLFHVTSEHAYFKGKAATAKICELVRCSKVADIEVWKKLFEAVVLATSLYCAEAWAWRYADALERVQTYFYKSMLYLTRSTPGYFLRIELGLVMLKKLILQKMLRWWCKILLMHDDRYPKLCFLELLKHCNRPASTLETKYNWCSQLKSVLVYLGYGNLWQSQNVERVKESIEEVLVNLQIELMRSDLLRLENSSYTSVYNGLTLRPVNIGPSICLASDLTLQKKRFFCQLRLAGEKFATVSYNGITSKFDGTSLCSICNSSLSDTVWHLLCHCPVFNNKRRRFFGSFSVDLFYLFNLVKSFNNEELLESLLKFYVNVGSERNFILENPL